MSQSLNFAIRSGCTTLVRQWYWRPFHLHRHAASTNPTHFQWGSNQDYEEANQWSWCFDTIATFLHSEFQLMWFFTQSTRSAKWGSVILGTSLIFLYRRCGAACRTCWICLTLKFNSMDLFNFDGLVIWLDVVRNNLPLAFLVIFLRIPRSLLETS